jgi:hypothetical protein
MFFKLIYLAAMKLISSSIAIILLYKQTYCLMINTERGLVDVPLNPQRANVFQPVLICDDESNNRGQCGPGVGVVRDPEAARAIEVAHQVSKGNLQNFV